MICQSLPQDPFPRLRVAKMLYSWGSLCRLLNSIPKNEAQHHPISHTQVVSLFYILFWFLKCVSMICYKFPLVPMWPIGPQILTLLAWP